MHTARPETNQPVEPRQESAHGHLGKGSRVTTFSDGLLPAAQSCWGWWWGGGGGGGRWDHKTEGELTLREGEGQAPQNRGPAAGSYRSLEMAGGSGHLGRDRDEG